MQENEQLQELKNLGNIIDTGHKVEDVLNSPGWKDVVEPLMDKMIADLMGGKQEGRYHNGLLDNKKLGEEKLQVLVSYKRALVDLHTYICDFVDEMLAAQGRYAELVNDIKESSEE